jgi:signal transduction histidine kinase
MMVLEEELSSLEAGSHLCAATVTRDERHQAVAAFLHDGMRRGECCALVALAEHQNAVCSLLNQAGLSTAGLRERGALVLRDPREIYAPEGKFDGKRTLETARLAIEKAHAQGFHGYRVAGVPGPLLQEADISPTALASYEADITDLMRATRSLALCAFDRRRMGTDLLAVMLQTHPLALLGGRLCHNPFCDPPSYSRGVVGDAKKINWMINQILHSEDGSRGLHSMNEALIREAVALSTRTEQQRQRSDNLQRALDSRNALLGLVARWLARPLPYLCARLESVLQDERVTFAREGFENCNEFVASLQRLAHGLQDVEAALDPTTCPEETDLVQIVSEAMASLPGLADRTRVDIRLVAPGRLVGWWDPARLRRVVRTLVEVGGEHGLGSPVELRLEDLGCTARLTVQFRVFGRDPCLASCARQANPSSVLPGQESPDDQLALALWPPRETIRQMGGSFGLSIWADARVRITIELPRSATGSTRSTALLH